MNIKTSFLEKVRKLYASWDDTSKQPAPETPEEPEADGLEALFQRLEEVSYRKQPLANNRSAELTELVNTFSLEELSGFLKALLLEDPELMELPLFPETRHISGPEAAYDWLMNLPYSTLAKARDILVSLFEAALRNELGAGSLTVIQKVKALTAKNHAGLPFEYLERKVRSGTLAPALRLELAQLMVLHEKFDLDFPASEALFSIEERPYMLPALLGSYLRAGLNGAKQALLALNQFGEKDYPTHVAELRPGMIFMLEEIARAFRKEFPADWQGQLASFADAELEIANDWLRELVEQELGVSVQIAKAKEIVKPGRMADEQPKAGTVEEWTIVKLINLNLRREFSTIEIRNLARAVISDKKIKFRLCDSIAKGLRIYGERAAENVKPLLIYLNKEANINLKEDLRDWRIELSMNPFTINDPYMSPSYRGDLFLLEEKVFNESQVFQKALEKAEEDERRLAIK